VRGFDSHLASFIMFTIGITTAPRGIVYIGQSLASYFDTWGANSPTPHVFTEPDSPKYLNRDRVIEHHNISTLGCVQNWWQMATFLYEETDTPYVMTCEDDILWSVGAKERIESLLTTLVKGYKLLPLEKIGFISPYCAKYNAPKLKGWRPAAYLKSGWCGCLCMIFPRASLGKLLKDKQRFIEYASVPERGPIHLDYAIGQILAFDEKMTIVTHAPTLITHLGECSTFPKHNEARNRYNPSRQANIW
jgi:hypothetical protein